MMILSIETSCDETAISIVETDGEFPHATYKVLGDVIHSQIEIHRKFGGVFPAVAKREHAVTLVPVLEKVLASANLPSQPETSITPKQKEHIGVLLSREGDLANALLTFSEHNKAPTIDLIAVTHGPGLEPALWVGVNFAKALSLLWHVPVIGINHMEGHIYSSIFTGEKLADLAFPAIALLISGGHTEIVLMRDWHTYELIGKTRDDAAGEAFDKVARMLGLPYPGGPEISKKAAARREKNIPKTLTLPRPMLESGNCDFSFSGLKTAVLYKVKDSSLTEDDKEMVAEAFEDAVTDVLVKKTLRAIEESGAQSLILGGGVSANRHIRASFTHAIQEKLPDVALYLPEAKLTTDNAVMIALAAHARFSAYGVTDEDIIASGNLSVSNA